MEIDIREHRYLEHGEHGGHLYGTKLDSVRDLIRAGKMCVLDCSPAALKILHNSTEFMPYVIFIAAPGMEQLKSLYDLGRSTGASNRNLTVHFFLLKNIFSLSMFNVLKKKPIKEYVPLVVYFLRFLLS